MLRLSALTWASLFKFLFIMSPSKQHFFGITLKGRPDVASGVHVNLERQRSEFFSPLFVRFQPGTAPSDALRAVFVPRKGAEVFKFSNCAFGVKCRRQLCRG